MIRTINLDELTKCVLTKDLGNVIGITGIKEIDVDALAKWLAKKDWEDAINLQDAPSIVSLAVTHEESVLFWQLVEINTKLILEFES